MARPRVKAISTHSQTIRTTRTPATPAATTNGASHHQPPPAHAATDQTSSSPTSDPQTMNPAAATYKQPTRRGVTIRVNCTSASPRSTPGAR